MGFDRWCAGNINSFYAEENMIKTTARKGQTLADIAIQTKGSIDALVDMAAINNISVTEVLEANQELRIPDARYNSILQAYVKSHGISPATEQDESGDSLRVFTHEFTHEFS